jgi:hypothetical protein
MRSVRYHDFPFNQTLLGTWVEHHGSRPWPVRHISAVHHLSIDLAAAIAEIANIGGRHND